MKLYGVTTSQAQEVMSQVSRKLYKGNLEFAYLEPHNTFIQFTLRVKDSHGLGARLGQSNGRHLISACWHAHRDFMRALFDRYPDAKLVSAQAVYNGLQGFEDNYLATDYKNIGSMMRPLQYSQACECRGAL